MSEKTTRHSGAALLAIVLVSFVVLSLVSAVVMNIAWQALRVEAWQTGHIETKRLDYIARSAANAAAEALSSDAACFGPLTQVGITSVTKEIIDGDFKADLDITIKGNTSKAEITSKVSIDSGKKVTVKAVIDMAVSPKTITWSAGN